MIEAFFRDVAKSLCRNELADCPCGATLTFSDAPTNLNGATRTIYGEKIPVCAKPLAAECRFTESELEFHTF